MQDVFNYRKENINFSITPQYYVPYIETVLRTTNLDMKIVQALRDALDGDEKELYSLITEKAINAGDMFAEESNDGVDWQKIHNAKDLPSVVFEIAEKLCPKYLLGFRTITNVRNERTVISSVFPFSGAGNSIGIFNSNVNSLLKACLLADFNSLVIDFIGKLKIGGKNFNFFIVNQLPVLPPSAYYEVALSFIVPRVMALSYTANDMTEWAKALWNDSSLKIRLKMLQLNNKENEGITDEKFVDREFNSAFLPPYIFDDAKRAVLRAELDAYFARLYGLTRTELQYILDPHSVMGEDYPSETFRVLQEGEIAKYGEYRTQGLVLEAWDRME